MADFHHLWNETTRLDESRAGGRTLDWDRQPAWQKSYPGKPLIALPRPGELDMEPAPLWEALHRRRSVRHYADGPMDPKTLAALLWACQGVTAQQGPYQLRTAPSAGALYPFETYLILNRVEGMEPGLAHFDPATFTLRRLKTGDLSEPLVDACLRQRFLAWAPVIFVWTAVVARCAWKYGDRATRYIGLDLGHVCGNLLTAASALGLGSCAVGAFLDQPMNELLEVDGEEEYVFYLASVGLASAGTPRTPGTDEG